MQEFRYVDGRRSISKSTPQFPFADFDHFMRIDFQRKMYMFSIMHVCEAKFFEFL